MNENIHKNTIKHNSVPSDFATCSSTNTQPMPVSDSWNATHWSRLSLDEKNKIDELFSNLIIHDRKKKKFSNLLELFQQSSVILFFASLIPWFGQIWVIWALTLTLCTSIFFVKRKNTQTNFYSFNYNLFKQYLKTKILDNKISINDFPSVQKNLHRLNFLEIKLSKRKLYPDDVFSFIFFLTLECNDSIKKDDNDCN